MFSSPYFSSFITILSYLIGVRIAKKFRNPLANPMLMGIILSLIAIQVLSIDYRTYMRGGEYLNFFVGPATVSLVVPLYKNIELVKRNMIPVLCGIIVGSFTAIVSVLALCKIFNVNYIITTSLLPQSITTAIAMPLAESYGGIGSLAVLAVIFRGILGAIVCIPIFKAFSINHTISQGLSLGTSSHVIGTTKAFEISEKHGAMSSLAIVISGILTTIYMPFIISIFKKVL